MPSPVVLKMRPRCWAISGSISSRRSLLRAARVPSSSAPISREYPATSAQRIAASRRSTRSSASAPFPARRRKDSNSARSGRSSVCPNSPQASVRYGIGYKGGKDARAAAWSNLYRRRPHGGPRVPSWEAFGRRPSERAGIATMGRHPKPFTNRAGSPSRRQGRLRGIEDAFRRTRPSARCRISQRTFARTRGNGRDARIPDLRALTPQRRDSTPIVLLAMAPAARSGSRAHGTQQGG